MIFILLIDVTKAMATVEEFIGVSMTWGKLERTGISKSSNKVSPQGAK